MRTGCATYRSNAPLRYFSTSSDKRLFLTSMNWKRLTKPPVQRQSSLLDFAVFREHFYPQKSKNDWDLNLNFHFTEQKDFQMNIHRPPFDHYLTKQKKAFSSWFPTTYTYKVQKNYLFLRIQVRKDNKKRKECIENYAKIMPFWQTVALSLHSFLFWKSEVYGIAVNATHLDFGVRGLCFWRKKKMVEILYR